MVDVQKPECSAHVAVTAGQCADMGVVKVPKLKWFASFHSLRATFWEDRRAQYVE